MFSFSFVTPGVTALPFEFHAEPNGTGIPFTYTKYTPQLEPRVNTLSLIPNQDPYNYEPSINGQTIQPSNLYSLTVPRIKCEVRGLDVSEYVENWDAAEGVGKEATGTLSLVVPFSWQATDFAIGSPVEITLLEGDNTVAHRVSLYTITEPSVSNEQGKITVTLTLGGKAKLTGVLKRQLSYCGIPPRNAGELAQNVAISMGANIGHLPAGHNLEEVVEDQSFRGLQTLVDVYAVTDYDAWENLQGRWQARKRGTSPSTPLTVNHKWYLENKWQPPQTPVPAKTIVRNTYNREEGYVERETRLQEYSSNYDPANTLPWFAGGWTFTETVTSYVGESIASTRAETFGYVPDTFPFNVSLLPTAACVLASPIPTTYRSISTETLVNRYAPVTDRNSILWSTERQINGLNAYQADFADPLLGVIKRWNVVNGLIARELTQYHNTRDENPLVEVCDHQKVWNQTGQRSWQWGLLPSGQYSLQSTQEVSYVKGPERAGGINKFFSQNPQWAKSIKSRRYDPAVGKWVDVPVVSDILEAPPNSVFLLPSRVEVSVEGFYDDPAKDTRLLSTKRSNPTGCRCVLDYDYAGGSAALNGLVTSAALLVGLELVPTVSDPSVVVTQTAGDLLEYTVTASSSGSTRFVLFEDLGDVANTLSRVPTLRFTAESGSGTPAYQRTFSQAGYVGLEDNTFIPPSPFASDFQTGQSAYGTFTLEPSLSVTVPPDPAQIDIQRQFKRGVAFILPPGWDGSFTFQVVTTTDSTYTQTVCFTGPISL